MPQQRDFDGVAEYYLVEGVTARLVLEFAPHLTVPRRFSAGAGPPPSKNPEMAFDLAAGHDLRMGGE